MPYDFMIGNSFSLYSFLHFQVAEKLANEAVKSNRQVQIVEYGGLRLLVPLTKSVDPEVQRLAAHALANLSVNGRLFNINLWHLTISMLYFNLDCIVRPLFPDNLLLPLSG
jgi:hypothetical protein